IRVPLLIVPPSGRPSRGVVDETVSLRDLPATIVDLAGVGAHSPFPGRSLADLWRNPAPGAKPGSAGGAVSQPASPNPTDPNQGRSPAHRGALVSLAEGDYVYIRNQGDGTEELFDERDDPRELINRAQSDAMRTVVERFRAHLDRLLTPRVEAGG